MTNLRASLEALIQEWRSSIDDMRVLADRYADAPEPQKCALWDARSQIRLQDVERLHALLADLDRLVTPPLTDIVILHGDEHGGGQRALVECPRPERWMRVVPAAAGETTPTTDDDDQARVDRRG